MKRIFIAIFVLLSFFVLPLSANRDWVTFTAKEANSKVLIDGNYKPSTFCIEWRVNGGKWTKKTEKSSPALTSTEIKLNNVGDVLEVRGQNPQGFNKNQGAVAYIKLKPSGGKVEVSGDIMTLIDTTTEKTVTEIPNQYCFYRLFEGGICLTSAKNLRLPSSTFSHCYMQMFSGCRLLEEGPDMSAITKIQAHACEKMFESCNSLKAMPAMPNLKFVGEGGCSSMFGKAQGSSYTCSSLETVPDLVAPYVADGSYQSMFSNCTKLEKAPKIYADIMHRNTCASMFNGCTSLTDVPDLEAQYLDDNCYNKMFYGCTALVNAPAIKATEIGCSYSGKDFNYVTCMQDMFRGCSSLRHIEVYFAKWYWKYLEKEYPTSSWVNGVTETTEGVFSAPCALPDERGTSRIPKNWQYNCFKTLSFDVATNGGYWKDRKDDILRVLKLEDVTTPPTAGRNLSEFVKWNTQPDGTGEDWDAAHKPTESTIYYAIFKQTGTPKEHCIEYTDFSATTIRIDTARFPKDKFVLGPWTQNVKDLNYGPYRSKSRYAIHNNPEEVDPRTGGNLYTILPNGDPSVRLGNWENHCAERMTYTYTVPADKNILTLYYAAVLEDPKHDSKEQPRFTLGILDKNNDTIDARCCSFNFIPQIDMEKEDPTWHAEGDVYWKEWTPVGVNLQDYIGQKVQIQLTTYDCAQGGHFGYAYFGLDCERPEISASSCGADADLTAPSGFTYRWYKEGEETTTLSTNQTFNPGKAGKGAGIYYCDLINLQNPDCKFGPLRAEVAAETPIAQFTINSQETKTEEGKEVDNITVSNTSYLKNDDGTTRPIDEEKTGFSWTVTDKNGKVVFSSSDKEPIIKLEKAGDFTINLVVSINSGSCESQPAETSVTVVRGQIKREEVAGTACADGTPTWEDSKSHPIVDAQGKTHFQLMKTEGEKPLITETYHDTTFSGIDTTLYILTLKRQYVTEDPTTATIQKGHTYDWIIDGVTYRSYTPTDEKTITDERMDYYTTGCDSVRHTLTLTVTDLPIKELPDTTCENVPYTWQGHGDKFKDLTKADTYRDTTHTAGIDTIHILYLTVNDTIHTIETLTKAEEDFPFMWNGMQISGVSDHGKKYYGETSAGCDSIVTLELIVYTKDSVTKCESDLPFDWNGYSITSQADDGKMFNGKSVITGLDSIVRLVLTVKDTFHTTDQQVICENGFPITWHDYTIRSKEDAIGKTYTTTSIRTGCDSIVSLALTVNDTIHTIDHLTKTDSEFPFSWNGNQITSAAQTGTVAYLHRQATGCDSIVTLDLQVVSTCTATARLTSSTLCADTAAMGVVLECVKGQITRYEVTFDAAAQAQQFQGTAKTLSLSAGQTENISLPVPHSPSSVSPQGQSYPRPDHYTLTVKATTSCDSVITFTLPFEVLYPASIIVQRWNDVLALTNERYNGGYTFSKIVWYNEGQTIVGNGEHNSYHYVPGDDSKTLNMGTNYWAELTRTDDGKTICTCKLQPRSIAPTGTRFAGQWDVAARRGTMTLTSNYSGAYIVYDVCGRQLVSGRMNASDLSQVIMTNVASGTYVVSCKGDNGEHDVKKVFVE